MLTLGSIDAHQGAIAQYEEIAAGGGWPEFERSWKAYMVGLKLKTYPGFDIPTAAKATKATKKAADVEPYCFYLSAWEEDKYTIAQANAELNAVDMSTFYTPGPKGYTDYPTL